MLARARPSTPSLGRKKCLCLPRPVTRSTSRYAAQSSEEVLLGGLPPKAVRSDWGLDACPQGLHMGVGRGPATAAAGAFPAARSASPGDLLKGLAGAGQGVAPAAAPHRRGPRFFWRLAGSQVPLKDSGFACQSESSCELAA